MNPISDRVGAAGDVDGFRCTTAAVTFQVPTSRCDSLEYGPALAITSAEDGVDRNVRPSQLIPNVVVELRPAQIHGQRDDASGARRQRRRFATGARVSS